MKIEVTVTRGETATSLAISPLAIVGWEKATNRRMSDLAGDKANGGMGMLDMATMAMIQERLAGLSDHRDVEVWLVGVDEIGPKVEDPTQPEQALFDAP